MTGHHHAQYRPFHQAITRLWCYPCLSLSPRVVALFLQSAPRPPPPAPPSLPPSLPPPSAGLTYYYYWIWSIIYILVGTRDLRTLWSPPVSLNRIYFEEALCFKQLSCPSTNSIFISMCILRDIPQQKNPRALWHGELPQLYMFPWKFESFCGASDHQILKFFFFFLIIIR
jgi:hypothetical protein